MESSNQEERTFEPLPDDWDEHAARLADSFISHREILDSEREVLARFAHLCLRFAHMEKRVQGEILCEIPAHLSVIQGQHLGSLRDEAEQLANAERENLELAPDGLVDDLTDLLDERGIKVVEWPDWQNGRAGAFMFDARTGPALLALAPGGSPAARFALAHDYCHLLADVDPYENRFCPHGSGSAEASYPPPGGRILDEETAERGTLGADESIETRADLFARAFFLPGEHFLRMLRSFGVRPSRNLDLPRLGDLAYYYGVETAVVLNRLADLELLPGAEARAVAEDQASNREATDPFEETTGDTDDRFRESLPRNVPARFANLGLALALRQEISVDQLAILLGVDHATAEGFLAYSEPPPEQTDRASLPTELGELWRNPEE